MKITIIYDNDPVEAGLKTGWGFSALIKVRKTPLILFDTGNDGASLLYNMERLGIDPVQIGIIVISHTHGDHTGGLLDILELNSYAMVYLPSIISYDTAGRDVITVRQPTQISEDVISTGELKGIEQALLIKTDKGIVVVTGCSHPGVAEILDVALRYGKVYGIIGGLHGFRDFDRLDGLSLICPCHCTQYKPEIRILFPQQYVACGTGLTLEI